MVIKNLKEYGFNTENKTYIIAEIGINHRGSVEVAKELIDSAVKAGVDAVKFQTYLTEQRIPKQNNELFKILKDLELPFEVFKELKEYANQYNVDFFSTPFDTESVEYLESIGTDLYKIASFDVVNHKLLKDVAKTGKPVILSVGMSNLHEIKEAYKILSTGTKNLAILHCISSYPTDEKDARLSNIYSLQKEFDCLIGQSDHTNEIFVPLCAVAAGAQIIEKHYKVDDDFDCIDAPVSITENQMKKLVEETRRIEKIFGDEEFGVRKVEEATKIYRRKG
jgi:N,N'-diacetyllegionaminate synthase